MVTTTTKKSALFEGWQPRCRRKKDQTSYSRPGLPTGQKSELRAEFDAKPVIVESAAVLGGDVITKLVERPRGQPGIHRVTN